MAKEWLKLQKGSETRICDCWRLGVKKQGRNLHGALDEGSWIITVWRVSLFGVFLLRIFSHLNWIRRDTPYLVKMRETTDQKSSEYGHSVHVVTFISSPDGKYLQKSTFRSTFSFINAWSAKRSLKFLKKGRRFQCTGFLCSSKPISSECKYLAFSLKF